MIYLIHPQQGLKAPCNTYDICNRLSIHPVCPPKFP